MPDRHDRRDNDVDSWLSGRIDPLPPPPGTFELIKRRARHRKYPGSRSPPAPPRSSWLPGWPFRRLSGCPRSGR